MGKRLLFKLAHRLIFTYSNLYENRGPKLIRSAT